MSSEISPKFIPQLNDQAEYQINLLYTYTLIPLFLAIFSNPFSPMDQSLSVAFMYFKNTKVSVESNVAWCNVALGISGVSYWSSKQLAINCWRYHSAISLRKVRALEQYIAGDWNFFNTLPKFQKNFNQSTIFWIFFQNFDKIDLLEFSINFTQSLFNV